MKKPMAVAAVFILLAAGVLWLNDSSKVQHASIGGEVTWVIEPGTRVEEGDALVKIAALSGGEAAAARAGTRGIVRKTMIIVGDRIKTGDSVAKIEKE